MTTTASPLGVPEDKQIMQARLKLQRVWNTILSPTEFAAWEAFLDDNPPVDMAGHTYVNHEPTTMSEILVTRETQYAWSQIFGVYRFNFDFVRTPSEPATTNLVVSDAAIDIGQLLLTFTQTTSVIAQLPVVAYGTAPIAAGVPSLRSYLRPLCFFRMPGSTQRRNLHNCYHFRYNIDPRAPLALSACYVDNNNMMHPASNILLYTG
jgi:hypothetical protein